MAGAFLIFCNWILLTLGCSQGYNMNLFLRKRQRMQIAVQSDKSMLWKVLDAREGILPNRGLWEEGGGWEKCPPHTCPLKGSWVGLL